MGLKTMNYTVKQFNQILPEAYGYIIECKSDRKNGYAVIGIFSSRENAENPLIKPYETKRIDFIVNRNENDRATAYAVAKQPRMGEQFNPETHEMEEIIVDEMFKDWIDDIVTEE